MQFNVCYLIQSRIFLHYFQLIYGIEFLNIDGIKRFFIESLEMPSSHMP
jgi:hypothetical protein